MLVEEDLRVEGHPYAIDKVQNLSGWDTIDMVKHDDRGRGGLGHLYSSKPPLLPTLMAAVYWVIYHVTGLSLGAFPYAVVRTVLIVVNVVPLVIGFLLLARLVERFGTTDWGRMFVMGAAVFGTFLTTFAVTINNHLPAAVCAMAAVYAAVRIALDGERRLRYFIIAGMTAAFAAACELPALAFLVALSVALLWKAPRQTLLGYVPAAGIVLAAFFAANWVAHGNLRPPYTHRAQIVRRSLDPEDIVAVAEALQEAEKQPSTEAFKETFRESASAWVLSLRRKDLHDVVARELADNDRTEIKQAALGAIDAADLQADRGDNWYDYAYVRGGRTLDSYWRNPQGVDRGEQSPVLYAVHILIGHHGIFSLTPVWLLSAAGIVIWLVQKRDRNLRELTLLIAAVSLVCLAFYLTRGPDYRNYGGVTSGLRWMFWFAPLWLLVMLPAADAMAARWWTRGIALVLLAVSVLSASYPVWNPWTSPWIVNYLDYLGRLGWIG